MEFQVRSKVKITDWVSWLVGFVVIGFSLALRGKSMKEIYVLELAFVIVAVGSMIFFWFLSKTRYLVVNERGITQFTLSKPNRVFSWNDIQSVVKANGPLRTGLHILMKDKHYLFIPASSLNFDQVESALTNSGISFEVRRICLFLK